jgi:pyruvate-ferredoxin/flavodoxin oxidoreductase
MRRKVAIDGNEAAAYVAHSINEVITIYPITPSSSMDEWSDQWSSEQPPNIWGTILSFAKIESVNSRTGSRSEANGS